MCDADILAPAEMHDGVYASKVETIQFVDPQASNIPLACPNLNAASNIQILNIVKIKIQAVKHVPFPGAGGDLAILFPFQCGDTPVPPNIVSTQSDDSI